MFLLITCARGVQLGLGCLAWVGVMMEEGGSGVVMMKSSRGGRVSRGDVGRGGQRVKG